MYNVKKVIYNVGWAFIGKIVSLLSVLLVGILVARYLGPSQYGLLNYVISYVSLFTIISNFGLDDIEVREMSRNAFPIPTILGSCIRLRLAFASIAYILIIITILLHNPETETCIFVLIYGLTVFPTCLNSIRNLFVSQLQNRYVVQSEIVRTVICALFKILLLYFKAPLIWFIIASALDIFIVSIGYYLTMKSFDSKIHIAPKDSQFNRYVVKEAFPLMLSSSAIIIYQRIDQVMIGDMIDDLSVGFFATAGRFADLVIFVPIIICQTLTPILVKLKKEHSKEEYNRDSVIFIGTIVWISIIMALIVSLTSSFLITYTFGEKYLAAIPILQIMAWKAVGTALSTTTGQLMIIDSTQKYAVLRKALGCIICIVMNLLIIPVYGVIGSAVITVFSVFCSGFIANLIIPPYRKYFFLQCKALIYGPINIFNAKYLIKA